MSIAAAASGVVAVPSTAAASPSGRASLPEGDYIVRFVDSVASPTAFVAGIEGVRVSFTYDAVFPGFAGHLTEKAASALRRSPMVVSIEANRMFTSGPELTASTSAIAPKASQSSPPWNLDRIDQVYQPLSGSYSNPATGAGVTAYVLDSGIRADHVDFGGRVASGYTAISDGRGTSDCTGHGTHVSGTLGGATFGVAKSVTLRPVRVLDCSGNGSSAAVIAGVNWVIGNHQSGQPAVANMSLGGSYDAALDYAVQQLINDGVTVVASAGNSKASACGQSPGGLSSVITVAGSGGDDYSAWFTNYGSCVDLYAPGWGIQSAWNTSSTASAFLDGTSMASPHVAGAAALLLQSEPWLTPSQVSARLIASSSVGVVHAVPAGTPNRLLFVGPLPTPPSNDSMFWAAPLAPTSTTLSATNFGATKEPSEPLHAGVGGGRSVWWTFTAPANGTLTLSTQGSNFDTVLAAYTGSTPATLVEVASNNDDGYFGESTISLAATSGTTYRIAVDGFHGAAGSITLGVTWASPPVNDAFASATVLPQLSATVTGTNVDASVETSEPLHAGGGIGSSVWWTFTAPTNGTLTLATQGSNFDTVLAAYTGSTPATLVEVASNDNYYSWPNVTSRISVAAAAGTTYRIAVDSRSVGGAITLVSTWIAPSANDSFASATALTPSSSRVAASNSLATKETSEPSHGGNAGGNSVWWTFTAPSSGSLVISTRGSTFDTLLGVYVGVSVSGLSTVASNNDYYPDGTSRVSLSVTSGTIYSIAVDGYAAATGVVTLSTTFQAGSPPSNDALSGAIVLTPASSVVSGSNLGATYEVGEPIHAGVGRASSVWWSFTAPTAGSLTLSTAGSYINTLLGVYTGSSVASLVEVASNNDYAADGTSQVTLDLVAGRTYWIAVDGDLGETGAITLAATWAARSLREYEPIAPVRVLDTRTSTLRTAMSTTTVTIAGAGDVPSAVGTAVLTVVAFGATAGGYVTVFPCGTARPMSSTLNVAAGRTVANTAIVRVGDAGAVCLFASTSMHLLVDVNGYLPTSSTYTALTPARLLETRSGGTTVDARFNNVGYRTAGSVTELDVAGRGGVSVSASSVVLNLTVTSAASGGYVTAYPCGATRPLSSTINVTAGQTIANAAFVGVGTAGRVCLFVSTGMHLIVDVSGSFPSRSPYAPLTPARLLDTRPVAATIDGVYSSFEIRTSGSITPVTVGGRGGVPANASSVVLNVTATGSTASGSVTVYPCGSPTPTALRTLVFAAGQTIANAALVELGTSGQVCVLASSTTHVILDVNGYFPA